MEAPATEDELRQAFARVETAVGEGRRRLSSGRTSEIVPLGELETQRAAHDRLVAGFDSLRQRNDVQVADDLM